MPELAISPEQETALDLVLARMPSEAWQRVDAIDGMLSSLPQVELPLRHIFTPGMYAREIFMRRDTLLTTRIHLTAHPFVISQGVVSAWQDGIGWQRLAAPFSGVTQPATRRVLYIHEDCIWTTFHLNPENKTDPDAIVRDITYSEGKWAELGIASAHRALPKGTS